MMCLRYYKIHFRLSRAKELCHILSYTILYDFIKYFPELKRDEATIQRSDFNSTKPSCHMSSSNHLASDNAQQSSLSSS